MPLRFAVLGCGFWSKFQLAAWNSIGKNSVECVALCDPEVSKLQSFGQHFGIDALHTDPNALFSSHQLDFVEVITDVDSHQPLVELAAKNNVPVITQKPMAPTIQAAQQMVNTCKAANVPMFVHENWRFQHPLRELKKALTATDSNGELKLGAPFRAHILYANSFDVFTNQPFLKDLDQFILTDIGSHILDVARYLFGDATNLLCTTSSVTKGIKGEDVATCMMTMGEHDTTVIASMSYASKLETDRFPETFVSVECENGAVELGPDFRLAITNNKKETTARRCIPPSYDWADPAYDLIHSSILACNQDILAALQCGDASVAETNAEDNFKTMQLVYGSYHTAKTRQAIDPRQFSPLE